MKKKINKLVISSFIQLSVFDTLYIDVIFSGLAVRCWKKLFRVFSPLSYFLKNFSFTLWCIVVKNIYIFIMYVCNITKCSSLLIPLMLWCLIDV